MPYKAKRICSWPGCSKLTRERFCEEHAKEESKRYEKYDRSKEHGVRYGARWRRIRNAYIGKHPLCELCMGEGRYTKAEEVHHILPLSHGGTNAEENLQALCKSCHSRIGVELGDRFGKRKNIEK